MDDAIINKYSKLDDVLAIVEQLNGCMSLRCSREELTKIVTSLIHKVPYWVNPVADNAVFYRGRISPVSLDTPGEYSYCPKEKSKSYGRCHSPGTTVLYGASDIQTVVSELAPEIGEVVYVGKAKILAPYKATFTAVGELDHIRRYDRSLFKDNKTRETIYSSFGELNREDATRALLVDAFFAEAFSKPASKDNEYKITSALIEYLLDPTKLKKYVDAVAYPSVAHRGGINYAIRPEAFDEHCEWANFYAYEITGNYGYGLYTINLVGVGELYDGEQRIEWVRPNT
ncbi:MAG: RES family NAD+ phosphorylase [Oceanospirillaceae bacterium]|nr:RES family NAD+ phosphorylase [Oceanospirillaceae bacterium]